VTGAERYMHNDLKNRWKKAGLPQREGTRLEGLDIEPEIQQSVAGITFEVISRRPRNKRRARVGCMCILMQEGQGRPAGPGQGRGSGPERTHRCGVTLVTWVACSLSIQDVWRRVDQGEPDWWAGVAICVTPRIKQWSLVWNRGPVTLSELRIVYVYTVEGNPETRVKWKTPN